MVTPRGRTYSRASAGDVYGGRFAPSAASFAATLPALGWSGSASISAPAIPPSTKYRNAQPYLFSSIATPTLPDRLGGPPGYDLPLSQLFGPQRQFTDWNSGWRWDNDGGDWVDSAGTRMGSAAWGSVDTPAAGGAAEYAVTVTAALQAVQSGVRKWNAWIMRRAGAVDGARSIAGRFHSNPTQRPRIEVTYSDTSSATLACRVSGELGVGTSQPGLGGATLNMNEPLGTGGIALEFDRPTKPVSSATLYFTVLNHWGYTCRIEFNLADPPLNTSPVTTGIAAAYPLDAGMSANASILGVHRCIDGSDILDFFYATVGGPDPEVDFNWSADVGGTGPNDATVLPRLGLGKFVGGIYPGNSTISFVGSSHVGDSFVPLAAGMGAMRFTMAKPAGMGDGFVGGDAGTGAVNAFITLPPDKIDKIDHIFTRYYMLVGTTADTGNPYAVTAAQKYEVEGSGPTAIKWTDMGGKFSISPCHKTKIGGNSGTAGGGRGWVLRPHWLDYWADPASPTTGSWTMAFEWDDFQNNPTGYNYNVNVPAPFASSADFYGWGQMGGLGSAFYAGRWYCIEEELKLNSVDTINAQDGRYWTPDGEVRVWVDGRLAYQAVGLVMRSLPVVTQPAGYIQIEPNGDPCRLGIKHLWFNWFHGGTTQNSIDRVAFITGLAWGTSRIGPMNIPSALPTWVPAPGEMARFTVGGGVLRNNFRDVIAPYYEPYFDVSIVNSYSGAGYAPDAGAYGSMRFYGGGHGSDSTNSNQVIDLTFDANGMEFVSLFNPTAWTGSTSADATNRSANSGASIWGMVDHDWGDTVPLDGTQCPPGVHSYSGNVVIPHANGGATYGTLFSALVTAGGVGNIPTMGGAHEFAVNSLTDPTANTWSRAGSTFLGQGTNWQGPLLAAFVPPSNRVYYAIGNAGTRVRWFDRTSGAHVLGAVNGMVPDDYNTGQYIYIPGRELLLHVARFNGEVQVRWMDVSVSDPSLGGTATLASPLYVDPFEAGKPSNWAYAAWCADTSSLIVGAIMTQAGDLRTNPEYMDMAAIYEIAIPATLSDPWPVTRRVTTGVTNIGWSTATWQQPIYMPKLKCWVLFQRAMQPGYGADSILVYRPLGT